MTPKLIFPALILIGIAILYSALFSVASPPDKTVDQEWWDGLSKEWQTILLINQNLSRQGLSIDTIQKEYINRLNIKGDAEISALNKSLHDLNEEEKFGLSYQDLYARAIRKNHLVHQDNIELETLAKLETLYMVNGPADLSPLSRLPHLRVLIINYCGIGFNVPIKEQHIDLEPIRNLSELRILQCASTPLTSLDPLHNLQNLEELTCDNTGVTSLSALKKLTKLRKLSIGSRITDLREITDLRNLEELYIKGCKPITNFSGLKKLKKLSLSENEYALVKPSYRFSSLSFLKDLQNLEFLDLSQTSYHGSLVPLQDLRHLIAVSLPPVSAGEAESFKTRSENCRIINAYAFQR